MTAAAQLVVNKQQEEYYCEDALFIQCSTSAELLKKGYTIEQIEKLEKFKSKGACSQRCNIPNELSAIVLGYAANYDAYDLKQFQAQKASAEYQHNHIIRQFFTYARAVTDGYNQFAPRLLTKDSETMTNHILTELEIIKVYLQQKGVVNEGAELCYYLALLEGYKSYFLPPERGAELHRIILDLLQALKTQLTLKEAMMIRFRLLQWRLHFDWDTLHYLFYPYREGKGQTDDCSQFQNGLYTVSDAINLIPDVAKYVVHQTADHHDNKWIECLIDFLPFPAVMDILDFLTNHVEDMPGPYSR